MKEVQFPKKQRIFGLTLVSSDSNWLVEKDSNNVCAKSLTKLFPNKDERFEYAVAQMKDLFASRNLEDGMDEKEQTEDDLQDLRLGLWKGDNICIHGASNYYNFEFFEQEVTWDDINYADTHTKSEKREIKLPEKKRRSCYYDNSKSLRCIGGK